MAKREALSSNLAHEVWTPAHESAGWSPISSEMASHAVAKFKVLSVIEKTYHFYYRNKVFGYHLLCHL